MLYSVTHDALVEGPKMLSHIPDSQGSLKFAAGSNISQARLKALSKESAEKTCKTSSPRPASLMKTYRYQQRPWQHHPRNQLIDPPQKLHHPSKLTPLNFPDEKDPFWRLKNPWSACSEDTLGVFTWVHD